jgi:catechol 2,3-dioxygenase-like lactoylglutathione lyase family enzyme
MDFLNTDDCIGRIYVLQYLNGQHASNLIGLRSGCNLNLRSDFRKETGTMAAIVKKLGIVSYNVSDWQRAKRFYGETLGQPVAAFITDEVGWMEFGEKDDVHLAIGVWRGPGPLPRGEGGAVAVFEVDDAYQAVAALRQKDVRCDDVIAIPQMVTYANFYDPDGNRLQVAGPPPKD